MDEHDHSVLGRYANSPQSLSQMEPKEGIIETWVNKVDVLKISDVAANENVSELPPRDALQRETLRPIVKFFIWANSVTGGGILALAMLEMFLPTTHTPIVTDKVLIALIGGLTVQVGAVIIAAFKGLFAK